MKRTVSLIAISLLVFAGCARQDKDANKSPEGNAQENPPTQACRAIVPALQAVVFIDAETVLVFPGHLTGIADEEAVNRDRVPLITRDGGESWNSIAVSPLDFDAICFSDVSSGWLVKHGSELWKTTDGGFSWSFVSKIEDDDGTLDFSQQAKFIDERNGWILGLTSLWHTDDGGETWSRHEFPWLVDGFFVRGESVWVALQYRPEQNNAVYETRDGGTSWDESEIPNTMPTLQDSIDIMDLCFVDEKTGWLADSRSLYRTDDSGKSWLRQRLPSRRVRIDSICSVGEQECWAAGYRVLNASENKFEAILLHTTDGGGSWQQVDVGVKQLSFDKVFFSDAQNGWLVCKDATEGDPLFDRSAIIYRTADGGVTWKLVLSVKSPYQS